MTTPVMSRNSTSGWQISFYVPASIFGNNASAIPTSSSVSIAAIPETGATFAVYEFPGYATEEQFAQYDAQVRARGRASGSYCPVAEPLWWRGAEPTDIALPPWPAHSELASVTSAMLAPPRFIYLSAAAAPFLTADGTCLTCAAGAHCIGGGRRGDGHGHVGLLLDAVRLALQRLQPP